jgi:hypothetical protein
MPRGLYRSLGVARQGRIPLAQRPLPREGVVTGGLT